MKQEHILRVPIKPGQRERILEVLRLHCLQEQEVDAAHRARELEQIIAFVDTVDGADFLFVYRRGRDLQRAGAKFMLSKAETDRAFARVLSECAELERATTVPVAWRWPAGE